MNVRSSKSGILLAVVAGSMVLTVASLGSLSGAPEQAPASRIHVRRDIMSLAPDGPEIAALRRAVKVMKNRPASDPTSWVFQSNIHSTLDTSNPAWNQCQHGNYFFLPWHRMYGYFFERIARAASGDPNFTMPYWNYTSPAARALPAPFRVPADDSNPLYVPQRNKDAGGINNGARLPASAAATFWLPFRLTHFGTTDPTGAAFGGLVVDRPIHLTSTMGSFESYHNLMHVLLGGENGLMSDPNASGLDPVFHLHHNNVDRLWKRWLDQGGGRANPVNDRNWMDQKFTFFDENGKQVEMAVRDALDTEKLGYRYDDDPPFCSRPGPAAAVAASRSLRPLGASKTKEVELSDAPTRIAIDLASTQSALARTDASLALLVEGIEFDKEPMVFYEVFLNQPANQAPDFQSVHYVGNLIFAGIDPCAHARHQKLQGQGQTKQAQAAYVDSVRAFDITDAVRELRARNLWNDRELTVTLVMNGLQPVGGAPVTSAGTKARFERITLVGS